MTKVSKEIRNNPKEKLAELTAEIKSLIARKNQLIYASKLKNAVDNTNEINLLKEKLAELRDFKRRLTNYKCKKENRQPTNFATKIKYGKTFNELTAEEKKEYRHEVYERFTNKKFQK